MAKRNNESTVKTDLFKINPNDIVVVDGFNSRVKFELDELKQSIIANGVLNPISVVPFTDEDGIEKYRLVDGERRYRAVMEAIKDGADITRVPAIFVSKSATQEDLLIQQIARNDGKPFTEYECALAIKKIMDIGGYQVQEVLKKLGWASWKAIYLTHLNRDERVQKLMREGKIEGVAVRQVYQAHGNKEAEAVEEILNGAKAIGTTNKKGKVIEKITLSTLQELDSNSKTIAKRDSERLLTGLKILFKYIDAYSGTGIENEIDLAELKDSLVAGKTITEIFEGILSNRKVD